MKASQRKQDFRRAKAGAGIPLSNGGNQREVSTFWLLALVFLSGFAALVYELLWFRQLGLVFGNTVQAAATVLTAFMVGLAWGAERARKWAGRVRNPLRLFAAVEAGIGLYALVAPAALAGVSAAYQGAALQAGLAAGWLTGLRLVLALAVLLVPTVLMGASMPVLCEAALRSRERFAARLGLIYGSNTAGATLGVLACGFVLVPQLGVRASNGLAAMVNLAVGAAAWWLARRAPARTEASTVSESSDRQGLRAGGLLAVAGLTGFLALAFETVWFRALVLVLGSTSHSFAVMVACFLLGLVLGSAGLGRLADRADRAAWALAISLAGMGIWTFVSRGLYEAAPEYLLRLLVRFDFNYEGMLLARAMLASVFLLPLATASGLAFTAVVRLIRDRMPSAGRAVGSAFSVNALGSAAGSAVAGFALLPAWGLERSLLLLGGAALVAGLAVLWRAPEGSRWPRLALASGSLGGAAGLIVLIPSWDPLLLSSGPYFSPRTHVVGDRVVLRESLASLELLFYREGTTATVAVTRLLDGRLHFSSDGKVEADTSPQSMVLQRMMGHLPMLLHPKPRRVLNIGLGAGVTAGALSCYPEAQLEIADIEPAVTHVAALWAERNHDLIRRGRHRLFVNDGRNHLLVTTNRYDVITSDPFEPVVAGAASLYTLEHFQLARSRLAPGGLMAQFLPLYELSREDLLMILRTFVRVFPRASVFFTGTDTILLGFAEGAEIRLATAAAKYAIPEVRASLAEIGMDRPERLLDMLVMDVEPGDAAVQEGWVNSDNHPFIEFSAPRSALNYHTDTNQKVLLDRFKDVPSAYLEGLAPEAIAEIRRGRDALRAVLEASLRRAHGDLRGTVELLARAARLAPGSPIIRNELGTSLGLLAAQAQQPGEALALYQEALRVNPKDFWAFFHLEVRARAEQQPELAAESLRQALEAYPHSPMFLAMRGRQRGLAGDLEGACKDLEAALKALPRRADFWHIYADFLDRAGRESDAAAARARARRLGGG